MRVILDGDIAALYQVDTKAINRVVKRQKERFPADFMFQLTAAEAKNLRYQIGTSSYHGGRRYLPYAFTEQGIAMLSGLLRSQRAIHVNIEIMRTFVRLRQMALSFHEISKRVDNLEKRHDGQFKIVFQTLRKMFEADARAKKRIGFE